MPVRHTRAYRRIAFLIALLFPTVCARISPPPHDYLGAVIITALILVIFVTIEIWDSHNDGAPQ